MKNDNLHSQSESGTLKQKLLRNWVDVGTIRGKYVQTRISQWCN